MLTERKIKMQDGTLDLRPLFDHDASDLGIEKALDGLKDALDLASDQCKKTWITQDGRRLAAIVPVDVADADDRLMAMAAETLAAEPVCMALAECTGLAEDKIAAWRALGWGYVGKTEGGVDMFTAPLGSRPPVGTADDVRIRQL